MEMSQQVREYLEAIDRRVSEGRDALAQAIDFGRDVAPAVQAFSDVSALLTRMLAT